MGLGKFLSLVLVTSFLLGSSLYARTLDEIENELKRRFGQLSTIGLTDGHVGTEVEIYLSLLRDYEVAKLRQIASYLLVAANEHAANRNALDLYGQVQKIQEAYDRLQRILERLSQLDVSPSESQNYAKSWHGILVERNSSFRAFVREILILFRTIHFGEGLSIAKARVALMTHLEHTQWALRLFPYLRSVSSFFFRFFGEIKDPHTPHFTPEMHRVLDLFGRGNGMRVIPQGFNEESQRRFQQNGLHVWVMNHRDIYLDPFFVSQILRSAACDWACHYAVDPFRYFGGMSESISSRMASMPDFLPVGDRPGEAIRRAKEIVMQNRRANIFIFPEATTSLIGDTAMLDPYFMLSFVRSLKRLDVPGGIHLHIVSTNVGVEPRVNFRQRISQYFRPGYEKVVLKYHGSISSDEIPRRIDADQAFEINARIWLAFHLAQTTNPDVFQGQLRSVSLMGSIQRMFATELRCKNVLNGLLH